MAQAWRRVRSAAQDACPGTGRQHSAQGQAEGKGPAGPGEKGKGKSPPAAGPARNRPVRLRSPPPSSQDSAWVNPEVRERREGGGLLRRGGPGPCGSRRAPISTDGVRGGGLSGDRGRRSIAVTQDRQLPLVELPVEVTRGCRVRDIAVLRQVGLDVAVVRRRHQGPVWTRSSEEMGRRTSGRAGSRLDRLRPQACSGERGREPQLTSWASGRSGRPGPAGRLRSRRPRRRSHASATAQGRARARRAVKRGHRIVGRKARPVPSRQEPPGAGARRRGEAPNSSAVRRGSRRGRPQGVAVCASAAPLERPWTVPKGACRRSRRGCHAVDPCPGPPLRQQDHERGDRPRASQTP